MTAPRRAVIDVGTNSVKLLVAELTSRGVHPLAEESAQTRLGAGFYETHRLSAAAIARTAGAVAAFAAQAARWDAPPPRVVGTSAARDATNAHSLQEAVREACGLELEIITGEQEAEWAFRGVASEPALHDAPLLIMDAGGGSTEFILGRGPHAHFSRSFRLGTVRLLEELKPADPPSLEDWSCCRRRLEDLFQREIAPALRPALARFGDSEVELVGTSGTASLLAAMAHELTRFDRHRIDATRLTRNQVCSRREQLWSLPLAARRSVPGLPPDRADVILTGVAIYEAAMETFGFTALRVSTRGLRFAALLDPGRL